MIFLSRLLVAVLIAAAPATAALALDAAAPAATAAAGLAPFNSEEGLARLSRSDARVNFPALANQFEAEYVGAFCGPASAAIVLNAAYGRTPDAPRDRGRIRPDDLRYLPSGADLSEPRFTQDNVMDKGPTTRAQVLGEPIAVDGKSAHDYGFQIRQLDALLKANGLATRLVVIDDAKDEQDVRADLAGALKRRGAYVIVNFQRKAAGQDGPAHISPLGAYDAQSDSVLVLDVNPSRSDWVWMPVATLVKAMRTFDTVENRGYIVVEPPH